MNKNQWKINEDMFKNPPKIKEQIVKDFGKSSYTKISRNTKKTFLSFEHQKLANDISYKIGKDVKLKVSKSGKGRIEIPFDSNEDLHLIFYLVVIITLFFMFFSFNNDFSNNLLSITSSISNIGFTLENNKPNTNLIENLLPVKENFNENVGNTLLKISKYIKNTFYKWCFLRNTT